MDMVIEIELEMKYVMELSLLALLMWIPEASLLRNQGVPAISCITFKLRSTA